MKKSKTNCGRFAIHKKNIARKVMIIAVKDMVNESRINNENHRDEMYINKYLCILSPKTFIERYGNNG